jgi:hypothetical protein
LDKSKPIEFLFESKARFIHASGFLAQFLQDQEKKLMLLRMSDTYTVERDAPRFRRASSHAAHKIGPHSRSHMLGRVDGRTSSGKLMAAVHAELLEHVGPHPTPVQRMLIQRACVLSLRLAQIDRKIFEEQEFTVIDNNQAVAWQNAMTRCLVALGVRYQAARNGPAALTDILAELDDVKR